MSLNNLMIKPLTFWCQHVVPLVYDDSLSYLEQLCKISAKVNEIVDRMNEVTDEWAKLQQWIDSQLEIYSVKVIQNLFDTGKLGIATQYHAETETLQFFMSVRK